MNTSPGYEPLAAVLQQALDQAQSGKGKERHANGLPFTEQPILVGTREVGLGGPAFQARKKILEALNCPDPDRAIGDLLGAINYVAAMVIYIREVNESSVQDKPKPKTKIHLKDKNVLENVLAGGGWKFDGEGNWSSPIYANFYYVMWQDCGKPPKQDYVYDSSWLEEVEVKAVTTSNPLGQ